MRLRRPAGWVPHAHPFLDFLMNTSTFFFSFFQRNRAFLAELSSAFLLRSLCALIEARKAKLPISDVFVSLYGNLSHWNLREG